MANTNAGIVKLRAKEWLSLPFLLPLWFMKSLVRSLKDFIYERGFVLDPDDCFERSLRHTINMTMLMKAVAKGGSWKPRHPDFTPFHRLGRTKGCFIEVWMYLVDAGYDLNARNADGLTALDWLAHCPSPADIEFGNRLIELGARPGSDTTPANSVWPHIAAHESQEGLNAGTAEAAIQASAPRRF